MAFTKETLAHLIGEFRGIDRGAGGGLPAGPCVCTAPRSSATDPSKGAGGGRWRRRSPLAGPSPRPHWARHAGCGYLDRFLSLTHLDSHPSLHSAHRLGALLLPPLDWPLRQG